MKKKQKYHAISVIITLDMNKTNDVMPVNDNVLRIRQSVNIAF